MEHHVNYSVVGTAVILLMIVFMALAVWFAGGYDTRTFNRYSVYFRDAVSGLTEGSRVSYRGVEVGRVLGIRLAEEQPDRIMVDIEVETEAPINRDTVAQLKLQGITGRSFIELRTTEADAPPLKRLQGEHYPVIQAQPSQLGQFINNIPELSRHLTMIARQFGNLLSDKNVDRVGVLLDETGQTARRMGKIPARLSALTHRISQTLDRVDKTMEAARNTAKGMGELVPSMKVTVTEMRGLIQQGRRLLGKKGPRLQRVAESGIRSWRKLMDQAQETLAELEELVRRLKEDPSQIIYRSNNRGVKVPQ